MGDRGRRAEIREGQDMCTSVVIFWKLWLFANAAARCIQSLGREGWLPLRMLFELSVSERYHIVGFLGQITIEVASTKIHTNL